MQNDTLFKNWNKLMIVAITEKDAILQSLFSLDLRVG